MNKKIYFLTVFLLFIFPINVFAESINESDKVTLSKCVDENSARFMLGENEIKVKFLGIDSATSVTSFKEDEINGSSVSEYVCSVLENAKEIKIEYDPKSDREDKYGRLLVWVYIDDVLLQENLVKQGYAKVAYLYDDYTYNNKIKEAEKYAKANKLGIWKEEEKVVDTNVVQEEKTKKNDNIFDTILNFINEIFEKFLKFIDDLINDML